MSLPAGRLNHRVVIQNKQLTQDQNTGETLVTWVDLSTVWAEIAPLSAREFVASDTEVNKVTTRITIRYRAVTSDMRVYHAAKEIYYNIEGVLSYRESYLEYLTLACCR